MSDENVIDPEKLLVQLSDKGTLDAEVIDTIAKLLREESDTETPRGLSVDDRYSYLVVLRKARAIQHRHILEFYLDTQDPLTAALVLETLTLDWGLVDEYLERVLDFALGVSWDEDQDVQQSAIKILGEFLYSSMPASCLESPDSNNLDKSQARVMSLLLSLFQDDDCEHWVRQAAYFSICRAAKTEWESLPPECAQLHFEAGSTDIDQKLISVCQTLVAQNSSEESNNSLGSSWPAA